MIDLIIPVYNNPSGLNITLASVNFNIFEVTVVDDGSTTEYNVSYPVKWIKQANAGPGWARQVGINNTSNDYLMFIDAGDIFLSHEVQEQILYATIAYPNASAIFWRYYYINDLVEDDDNRLHGNLYKRQFLNQYGITFCKEGSYMNEDIGFNRTCRIMADKMKQPIKFIQAPIVQWIWYPNSITQNNGMKHCYKWQNKGLAINGIHTIEICRKNHFIPYDEIHSLAGCLYYWFIRAAVERPDLAQYAWEGAYTFYKKYEKIILRSAVALTEKDFLECESYYTNGSYPMPIDFNQFYRDILKSPKMPPYYVRQE